jgi:hypothetical protein
MAAKKSFLFVLAIGATTLALIAGGFLVRKNYQRRDAEECAIKEVYVQFRDLMQKKSVEEAFNLFSRDYRQREILEAFSERFEFVTREEYQLHSNCLVRLKSDTAFLFPMDSRPNEWFGAGFYFKKADGKWYLTGELMWYKE